MRRLSALALVLTVAAVAGGAAFAAQSPQGLRAAILKAVDARQSVHYVSTNSGFGVSVRLVSDVAPGRGIQRISFSDQGKSGTGTVLVLGRLAYIRGDAFTLSRYFSFKKVQATKYAGKWIYIPRGDRAYAPVAADATYGSFASGLLPTQNLAVVKTTSNGKKLVGVRGDAKQQGIPFVEWVYAPSSGTLLPVEEMAVAQGTPGSGKSRVTMSRWNEAVHLKAPAHAVSIATVRGNGGGGPVA
jgi:hypothetical protein